MKLWNFSSYVHHSGGSQILGREPAVTRYSWNFLKNTDPNSPRFTELKSLSIGPSVYILKNFPDGSHAYPQLRTPYESQLCESKVLF